MQCCDAAPLTVRNDDNQQTLHADAVIIATGSVPRFPVAHDQPLSPKFGLDCSLRREGRWMGILSEYLDSVWYNKRHSEVKKQVNTNARHSIA